MICTRIMISKGQRPFSSTRAVRVFWHFLSKKLSTLYWVTLRRPLGSNQIRTSDPYGKAKRAQRTLIKQMVIRTAKCSQIYKIPVF